MKKGEVEEIKNKEGRGQNWGGGRKNKRKKDTKVLQKEKRFFPPQKCNRPWLQ